MNPEQIYHVAPNVERLLEWYTGARKKSLVTFGTTAWQPAIDVYETPDALVVIADLAGLRIEDIELTIDRGVLVLRGMRPEPPRQPNAQYHALEIQRGLFERVIRLPIAVDADGATANYQDGLLEIYLPKARRNTTTTVKIRTG